MGFLGRMIALASWVVLVLVLLRFVAPKSGLCTTYGSKADQRTLCFNVFEFKGDDFNSIFRIDVVNTIWRRQ